MKRLGLIGGTGLDRWGEAVERQDVTSVYGQPSSTLLSYLVEGVQVFFLPRHGEQHTIPPHAVNYRANIDVFRQMQVEGIVAINAVGGISANQPPGSITIPDQLIDYTWGREHSFSLTSSDPLQHVEFATPFDGRLRKNLIKAAEIAGVDVNESGCLGVCQGPRLETAAEVLRLQQDGCDMVGMTTMPEAVLAREAGLDYASICVNANWAAGLDAMPVTMKAIDATLKVAMLEVRKLLPALIGVLDNEF